MHLIKYAEVINKQHLNSHFSGEITMRMVRAIGYFVHFTSICKCFLKIYQVLIYNHKTLFWGGACGVMVIVLGNVKILDEAVWISHSANLLVSSKVKLATIVEGNPKAPFSIATTSRCRGGRYSIPRIAPLYPWTVPYNAEC